jgi:hypothetical protein
MGLRMAALSLQHHIIMVTELIYTISNVSWRNAESKQGRTRGPPETRIASNLPPRTTHHQISSVGVSVGLFIAMNKPSTDVDIWAEPREPDRRGTRTRLISGRSSARAVPSPRKVVERTHFCPDHFALHAPRCSIKAGTHVHRTYRTAHSKTILRSRTGPRVWVAELR